MNNAGRHDIFTRRSSGILLHITSLPSPYGIGDLGPQAYAFLTFLARSSQRYWQILPTCPTSSIFGDSPYMSPSSLAGNPLLISPELLVRQHLLRPAETEHPGFSEYLVDYPKVTTWKKGLLDIAWQRFRANGHRQALDRFRDEYPWAADHGLFMALKKKFRDKPWYSWPRDIRLREPGAVAAARKELAPEIDRVLFTQYLFFSQWKELRVRARGLGLRLIGDLPIYVGLDSCDVWANQAIFDLDPRTGRPRHVAGVPPDYFSATGQRWGNPLYRWHSRTPEVRDQLHRWWLQRFRCLLGQVDVIRLDHFRGFEAFWQIPAQEKTAVRGRWRKGPGKKFFRQMERELGPLPIIAEDLGTITPAVETLRDSLGYPGMKILLFAFDGNPDNTYLPQNITPHSVLYTGTHDNDTAVGWYLSESVPADAKQRAKRQANRFDDDASTFHRDMIYLAHSSVARLTILPMQDVLGFGNDCRMNTPGTSTGNWRWRLAGRFLTDEVSDWLGHSTRFFGRFQGTTLSAGKKHP